MALVIVDHPKHIDMLVTRYREVLKAGGQTKAMVWATKYCSKTAWPKVRAKLLALLETSRA